GWGYHAEPSRNDFDIVREIARVVPLRTVNKQLRRAKRGTTETVLTQQRHVTYCLAPHRWHPWRHGRKRLRRLPVPPLAREGGSNDEWSPASPTVRYSALDPPREAAAQMLSPRITTNGMARRSEWREELWSESRCWA